MNLYLGTFLIAFATLTLEVTLSRFLSVVTWYHMAFFAISTAMLGMTAGATTVYLKSDWFKSENYNKNLAFSCFLFSISIPLTLLILCTVPLKLEFSPFRIFSFGVVTLACSLPFYFSGIAITAILTKGKLPIGKLYASDLIGAGLGCLFVIGILEILDAPSLILICSIIGFLSALVFIKKIDAAKLKRNSIIMIIVFIALITSNHFAPIKIQPLFVKGIKIPLGFIDYEKWNSFSRIVVSKEYEKEPQYWGPSPLAPKGKIKQHFLNIDGEAATVFRKFSDLKDIEHLKYDMTNIGYYIRPSGGACIIGVGAGKDLQSAIYFGHEKVTGVEVNPIIIDLIKNKYRKFTGLADRNEVNLVVDEARSYLSRVDDKFSIIQMSLIDTWASTGAGAFTLTENSLYTIEAWQVFFKRLKPDGVFTVSRWYNPNNISETGRILSLAVASLLEYGVKNPSKHIMLTSSGKISSLIVSIAPFSEEDINKIYKVCSDLQYSIIVMPGDIRADNNINDIVVSKNREELYEAVKDDPLNLEPTTDENPYFFNMLRLSHLESLSYKSEGAAHGNLIALITLSVLIFFLLLLTIVTILVPLIIKTKREQIVDKKTKILWSGAFYFSLIGAGFMTLEIALIQKLSLFLGHPVYALGILLFTIIISTGFGSFLSERIRKMSALWTVGYPILTAVIIMMFRFVLPPVITHYITYPMLSKIIFSILMLFPVGLILGFFFPIGMRIVKTENSIDKPWFWALNGIFGVLCSAFAVFISINFGISINFYIASICYAILPFLMYKMHSSGVKKIVSIES